MPVRCEIDTSAMLSRGRAASLAGDGGRAISLYEAAYVRSHGAGDHAALQGRFRA
jgi:hypothetical protein